MVRIVFIIKWHKVVAELAPGLVEEDEPRLRPQGLVLWVHYDFVEDLCVRYHRLYDHFFFGLLLGK